MWPAQVSLEERRGRIEVDPGQATNEQLIAAVESAGCRAFPAGQSPTIEIAAPKREVRPKLSATGKYTCPMDPEIVQDGPGTCPKCGMALEPMKPTAEEGPDPELVEMQRRFWIGGWLALPVFLIAMAGLIPSARCWHWLHAQHGGC